MNSEWVLVDIQRNRDSIIKDEWWKCHFEGRTVWKNFTQYKSGHEERCYYVECRDERYSNMNQVRVAIRRVFK